MIEETINDWHQYVRGELSGGIDSLLADEVVFYSPIVFSAQKGRDLAKLYLGAAGNTLVSSDKKDTDAPSKFRYTKEIKSGNHAMLEFETEVDGLYVNGVDIFTCDDDGKITELKVMIRPLQAINAVHAQMRAMLEKMQKAG